ncbi:type IV pilus modification protein PilV [Reinekea sp.]|jgi:type IV pilus assembly protein PilV|uniref:type IV pilus modification protein PilV n=1 Tax=Reinekea sp. TaxID=1970455 RepID=UPI002A800FE2|nr:type IV pilus modification protein PilV [Reinekea sp.]
MKTTAASKRTQFASRHSGATLIEVLVAILVFSIGLLGVASTQTVGLTNTQSALHRSHAAQLSYELVDLIRANPVEARKAVSVFTHFETTGTVPTEVENCLQVSGACSAEDMANTVLARWTARLQSALPDGEATLSLSGEIFQLRIRWADYRNDQIKQTLNADDEDIASNDIDKITDRITEFRI